MNRNEWKKVWHEGVYLAKNGVERTGEDYYIPESKSIPLDNTDINDKEWVACVRSALLSTVPSLAFEHWRKEGWLAHALPEINKTWGMNQPEAHHPEIDTGIHIMMVIDRAAADNTTELARWAALAHDFAKHSTYKIDLSGEFPRYSYHGHEKAGVPFVEKRFTDWGLPTEILNLSKYVTEFHGMVHTLENLKPTTILNIIKSSELDTNPQYLEAFCQAVACDDRGRKGMFNNTARGTELLYYITNNLIKDRLSYDEIFEQDWLKKVNRLKQYQDKDISGDLQQKESLRPINYQKYDMNSVKESVDSFIEMNNKDLEKRIKHGI